MMFIISIAQGSISYTLSFGELQHLVPRVVAPFLAGLLAVRFGLTAAMVALWALKYKKTLFRLIIATNTLFTLTLLSHADGILVLLFGSAFEDVRALLSDVMLMIVTDILIFSVWYWIIDPPGVEDTPHNDQPWDFLFPQRAADLPHYNGWHPRYADYLFLAFTTCFAFSPCDTLPLTRRAKILMLLQAAISAITLIGIVGSVINILAGGNK